MDSFHTSAQGLLGSKYMGCFVMLGSCRIMQIMNLVVESSFRCSSTATSVALAAKLQSSVTIVGLLSTLLPDHPALSIPPKLHAAHLSPWLLQFHSLLRYSVGSSCSVLPVCASAVQLVDQTAPDLTSKVLAQCPALDRRLSVHLGGHPSAYMRSLNRRGFRHIGLAI